MITSLQSFDIHLLSSTLKVFQPLQVAADLVLLQDRELLVPAHKGDLHAVRLHLSLVAG